MAFPWETELSPELDLVDEQLVPPTAPPELMPWPPPHFNFQLEEAQPPPWMAEPEPPPPAPAPILAPSPAQGGGLVPLAQEIPDAISGAAPVVPRGGPVPAELEPPPPQPVAPPPPDALAQEEQARIGKVQVGQGYTQRAADVLAQHAADEQRIQTEEASKAKAWETDLRNQIDELKGARIDRRRLFKEAGIGGQLAMLGGAILNGFVAPLQGGRNQALEIIQHMVDQDIQAQEADIASQRATLGAEQGLYSQYLAHSGDRQKSRALVTAGALDALDKQMAAEQAMYDSELIRADIQLKRDTIAAAREELILKNGQQQFENQLNLRKLIEQERAARVGEKLEGGRLGLGFANLREQRRQFDLDLAHKRNELLAKGQTAHVEALDKSLSTAIPSLSDVSQGLPGIVRATSPEAAKAVQDKLARVQSVAQGMQRLGELYDTVGQWGARTSSPEAKEAEGLRNMLINNLAVASGQGAVGNMEYERFKKIVGDPKAWRDQKQLLDGMQNQLKRDANADLQQKVIYADGRKFEGYWEPPPLRDKRLTVGGKVGQESEAERLGAAERRTGAAARSLEEDLYGPRPAVVPAANPPSTQEERLFYGR